MSLTMFCEESPVVVASWASDFILRLEMPVGATLPLHAFSAGKPYLSALPDADLEKRLAEAPYPPHADTSI